MKLSRHIAVFSSLSFCLIVSHSSAKSHSGSYAFGTLAGNCRYGYANGPGAAARFNYPSGVATDSKGNVFVVDEFNHVIRKITTKGVVSTFAGKAGFPGSADGVGAAAQFDNPHGLGIDSADNVYVADSNNYTIRKIAPDGTVTTLAGSPGQSGTADGTGAQARFTFPWAIAVNPAGNLFVTDSQAETIREVTPLGVVTTFAGSPGQTGSADGTGSAARFLSPTGIGSDKSGNLFLTDTGNDTIRKITPQAVVTTFAGMAGMIGSADGVGSAARFFVPKGLGVAPDGNVYVADEENYTIRRITPDANVTTFAGQVRYDGYTDGTGSAARFYEPVAIGVDNHGTVYVGDSYYNLIRKITPAAVVTTLAGLAGGPGSVDGTGSAARFDEPADVTIAPGGELYAVDTYNSTLRQISPDGEVSTLAGKAQKPGSQDGTGSNARFNFPFAVAADNAGNIYVADTYNQTIRMVTAAGVVTTLAGSPKQKGSIDGTGAAARFNTPEGIAVDSGGNVYVADTLNDTIRKITSDGVVTTFAGKAGAGGSVDGMGSAARFDQPIGLAIDSADNLFVADSNSSTIREISPGAVVTTVAGRAYHNGGNDGPVNQARFRFPSGIAVDTREIVYVADTFNNSVREFALGGSTITIAGIASPMADAEADGIGATARFWLPSGMCVDAGGTLYLADFFSNTIRIGKPAQ